ncbi:CLUMA_CG012088, isoform A [Clunio marinus]|uniref:EGF domain-specific O-linked N-acetylglucosamine transferase n=1 Tax=Clunio marinus TaxID=568069 RepID=A0A1J1IGQ9_9DIPT|nr:CLUMA_CG012088, isoform A [Clunio marinus]
MNFLYLILLVYLVNCLKCEDFSDVNEFIIDIDLPENHLSQYFNKVPEFAKKVNQSSNKVYKEFLSSERYDREVCWGYEYNCKNPLYTHKCPGNHTGYVESKKAQFEVFYAQADFGFVKQQLQELKVYCEPTFITDSSLECSKYLRFCRGRNLMLNFTNLINRKEPLRYATDVLKQGEIGGFCKFNEKEFNEQTEHLSALQSWGPELRYFESLSKRPIEDELCDVVIDKPTYIMKIDSTYNMYHHFCDFFNLYASQHVNFTHPGAFSSDVNILIWESYIYSSPFSRAFEVFSENPIWDLNTYRGKVVCFKNLVFPLLPRMIFGLYYNTPLINGCENSGLFHAFAEHVLHRLQIKQHPVEMKSKLRITFLSRETKYRKVRNEKKLLKRISSNSDYVVKRVNFAKNISFEDQLKITRNTDIFIGIHGAGLTHLLFLPKWATLFELYNCEDPNCYKDLARLRGVNYITWEDESLLEASESDYEDGSHAKFKNFSFEVDEFERLVKKAADAVINHSDYKEFVKKSSNKESQHDEL